MCKMTHTLHSLGRTWKRVSVLHLDGWRGPWGWMATDLATVLIGPLFVVELQLLCSTTVVIPYRLCLLCRGLV